MGLDENYGTLRSNVLAQDPIPPLGKVYSLVVQDERVKSIVKDRDSQLDSVAFATRRMSPSSSNLQLASNTVIDRKLLSCTHCG